VSDAPSTTSNPRVPWWLWLNVLSLDAPIVAVLWQAALATVHDIHLPQVCYLTLGLAVWLIYMVDHTLDGLGNVDPKRVTARHAFYRRNRMLFMFVVIPAATLLLGLLALTAIPQGIMWRGFILGMVVGVYLLHYAARKTRWLYITGNMIVAFVGGGVLWVLPVALAYKLLYGSVLLLLLGVSFTRNIQQGFRLLPKELVCGYLFAVGSSLCVNFYTYDQHGGPSSLETIVFGLLCTLNCIGIACYERDIDLKNDPNAITQTWPGIARVYPILLLTLGALTLYTFGQHLTLVMVYYSLGIGLSTILLGLVHHQAKRLNPELSHVLADAALAVPMLIMVMLG